MKKNISDQARVLYRAAFNGETMPAGWRVYFVDRCRRRNGQKRSDRVGQCGWSCKRIEVIPPGHYYRTWRNTNWIDTLVHEFVHQRCPRLRHGKEFQALVDAAVARLWQT